LRDGTYDSSSIDPTAAHIWGDDYSGTANLRVTDNESLTGTDSVEVSVVNLAPIVDAGPYAVNYSGEIHGVSASFSDAGIMDTHTAKIDWGDGSGLEDGSVVESGGSGTITGSHRYCVPGDYTITVTVTDDDGGKRADSLIKTVVRVPVDIDIKPGNVPNSLNLNGNGVVPVSVFGSEDLDVSTIVVSTVRFGVTGFEAAPVHNGHIEDLNDDGINDIVLHFREGDLRIAVDTPGNAELTLYLTARLTTCVHIVGADIVRITPNDENSRGKGGMGPK
jgi:hypothetical protein